jgi:hypothetical protein
MLARLLRHREAVGPLPKTSALGAVVSRSRDSAHSDPLASPSVAKRSVTSCWFTAMGAAAGVTPSWENGAAEEIRYGGSLGSSMVLNAGALRLFELLQRPGSFTISAQHVPSETTSIRRRRVVSRTVVDEPRPADLRGTARTRPPGPSHHAFPCGQRDVRCALARALSHSPLNMDL